MNTTAVRAQCRAFRARWPEAAAREFDPRKVGLVTGKTSENTFVFNTRDAAGSPIAGNPNLGHDYGNAKLTDDERWALVEYMKAVGGKRVGDRVVPNQRGARLGLGSSGYIPKLGSASSSTRAYDGRAISRFR